MVRGALKPGVDPISYNNTLSNHEKSVDTPTTIRYDIVDQFGNTAFSKNLTGVVLSVTGGNVSDIRTIDIIGGTATQEYDLTAPALYTFALSHRGSSVQKSITLVAGAVSALDHNVVYHWHHA